MPRNGALLAGAAASWGIGTVVSKQAVAELAPLTLLLIQLALSVLVMGVVVRLRGESLPSTREGRLLGRLGLLNPGLAYALSLIGLTQISASMAVLLWASEPILILGLAALVLGEAVGLRLLALSGIAITGLLIVVFDPSASGSLVGVGLTVAGVVVCAAYTVLTRRWLLGSDATFPVVLSQQLHALGLIAIVAALAFAAGQPILPSGLTPVGLGSAAVSGLLYYAVAYSCYLSALRNVRASVAAASFYLIPVFGVAGAWLTGERMAAVQWVGAVVVVGAVALITTRLGSEARDQPSSADASAQIPITPSPSSRA